MRRSRKLLAISLGFAAALAASEAAARLAWRPPVFGEVLLYRPHHHISYVIAARAQSMGRRGPHNSLGFRGPEVADPKPKDALRIACIGGSTTYGTTQDREEDCWPRRLEACLRPAHSGVEVINAGIPAHNSAESLQLLRERILPLAPDVVVLYLGYNDVIPRLFPNFRSDYAHFRTTWRHPVHPAERPRLALAAFLASRLFPPEPIVTLRQLTCRPHEESVVIEGSAFDASSAVPFERNVRTLVDAAAAFGARPVLATQWIRDELLERDFGPRTPPVRKGLAEHAESVRRVAAERGVPLVDLEREPADPTYFEDFAHHTDAGALRVAQRIAESLERSGALAKSPREPR